MLLALKRLFGICAVQMLLRNGWQGLLLVFLCLWLFFSFRLSFWVVMGLPVSFLGGLYCMSMIGYSINMITMVALLLAIVVAVSLIPSKRGHQD